MGGGSGARSWRLWGEGVDAVERRGGSGGAKEWIQSFEHVSARRNTFMIRCHFLSRQILVFVLGYSVFQ